MAMPSVAAVIPALNAEGTLAQCLQALAVQTMAISEVIVFDDGSTDGTTDIIAAAGVRRLTDGRPPRGPAHGRNRAATLATADLLLFVDADVVLAPDAVDRLVAELSATGAVAAFGSYDDTPHSTRTASLYVNLRHHFVHQHGEREASTFWSGIGLIDRGEFLRIGGFNEKLFRYPSIEDIELGIRLGEAGRRIRLVPEAQGTHWKDWTVWRVWHTDIVRRAYPWSCLIADRNGSRSDLNLASGERAKAILALAIPSSVLASFWNPAFILAAIGAGGGYLYQNRQFFRLLARRLGRPQHIAAIGMHWVYHVYASLTFAGVMIATRLGLRRGKG